MARQVDNKLYSNFLLPSNFIERWKNGILDERYIYLDFSSDITMEVDVDNQPFIQKLFSVDDSFDEVRIEKQWEKISFAARKLVDLRILNQNNISITKNETLFLKYFSFFISLVNGDHRFYFDGIMKSFRIFDVLSEKISFDIRHKILTVINYALFELYDLLFTEELFSWDLQEYVDESRINFADHAMHKRIIIPDDEFKNQSFRFLQANFYFYINNTFMKFFKIPKKETLTFYLTNKSIVNFFDEETKMILLSVLVIDPNYAIGFVNMGPGRGEYRPFFQYFKKTSLNKLMLPAALIPEHKFTGDGVYLENDQKFEFTPYEINFEQTKLINEGLSYRQLRFDLKKFYIPD
jgi:hypothetical protein